MSYEYEFLIILCVTLCIEIPVLFLLVRRFLKINNTRIPNTLLFFTGLIANLSTLPYVWFIVPTLLKSNLILAIISAIMFAFIFGSITYYFVLRVSIKKAMALSFICNLILFLMGWMYFSRSFIIIQIFQVSSQCNLAIYSEAQKLQNSSNRGSFEISTLCNRKCCRGFFFRRLKPEFAF